ncbi:ABC transporter substrate-binding protein [Corynebacterium sp. 335C]
MTRRLRTAALLLSAALGLVACSADDAGPAAGEGAAGEPGSIVSLSPTATEMLYAIGAGDRVTAVDENSDYPAEAPVTEGLSGFELDNAESVLAFDPDLVVVQVAPPGLGEQLDSAGVELLELPAATTLDEAYAQVETLGEATGEVEGAERVADGMRAGVEQAVASVPAEVRESGLTYFHEVSPELYSVTDATFLGEVYGLFGLSSVAGGAPDGSDGGYPQLNPEAVIDADPDLVFLADAGSAGVTPQDVAARPGWDTVAAVRAGNIFELDEDLASRWGPRLPELVRHIAAALSAAELPAGVPA